MRWVKGGEVSPSGLAEKLAMKPQAVSNQLQRLSDRGIVQTRREGTMSSIGSLIPV